MVLLHFLMRGGGVNVHARKVSEMVPGLTSLSLTLIDWATIAIPL